MRSDGAASGYRLMPQRSAWLGSLIEEDRLLVGVELSPDGHDALRHVHHRLHHLPELLGGDGAKVIEGDRLLHDLDRGGHERC